MKKALIIGITGQDGSYLAEFLLNKNYDVHGLLRRSSVENTERIDGFIDKITCHYGDLTDSSNINFLIQSILPDEIYNLGAQSHVQISFDIPEYSADVDGLGQLRVLEACHQAMQKNKAYNPKIYFAGTSELYGGIYKYSVDENTPFHPRSPYAIAKLYGFWITKEYRTAYNMFCCNGILFNHESPRRGKNFVTRKITSELARIKAGKSDYITLGNLNAYRDWGDAEDYVKAMWLILQHDIADDYVIATNETHTVREFVEYAFKLCGFDIVWSGEGYNEVGYDQNGIVRIKIDQKLYRPTEVDYLLGNYKKAYDVLGWKPETTFKALVEKMVKFDNE